MALTQEQIASITSMMEQYIDANRPPEDIRNKVDLGWRLDNQSVYIFEIRPRWDDPTVYREHNVAKATWVQKQKIWKIFWLRANGNWERYPPLDSVGNLQRFLMEVERDPKGCFFG